MTSRALCALFLLASGCTIHVIEQPALPLATTPAPVLVAAAPEARPAHLHHEHRARPTAAPRQPNPPRAAPEPQPPRFARPTRSEVTTNRQARPTQPRPDEPLYVPLRSLDSDKASGGLAAQPPGERHKVKIPGT